jgi:hypothetical protein
MQVDVGAVVRQRQPGYQGVAEPPVGDEFDDLFARASSA